MPADRSPPRVFVAGPGLAGCLTTISVIVRMQAPTFNALKWVGGREQELSVHAPDGRFVLRYPVHRALVYDVIDDAERDSRYRQERDFMKVTDGVVFVADSQEERLEANVDCLRRLESVVSRLGRSPHDLPVVIALNKRDLPNALPIAELERALKWPQCVYVPTVAKTGNGVGDVLRAMIGLTRTARPYR